jgi:O-antigen/teichoic acid export membrane protein
MPGGAARTEQEGIEEQLRCANPEKGQAGHGIVTRFAHLLSAFFVREVLQAIFLVYLARKSTTSYGQFMLAISLGQILLFISEFGINQHLVSLLVRDGGAGALSRVTTLKAGLLGLGGLGIAGFIFWQDYPPVLAAVVLILGAGVGLEALANSFFVSFQVKGRQDLESRVRIVSAVLGFGYGIIAVLLGAAPVTVAFYKLIETFSNLGAVIFLAGRQMNVRLHWIKLREVWDTGRESMILTLMAISGILYNKVNVFFLQHSAGAEGVAQYSATWQLVDGISYLVSGLLLRNILFPLFSGLWERDSKEFGRIARSSASWLLAAALPTMFILFCESDRLIPLIYGPKYTSAIWTQKILAITVLISFVHNLAADIMVSIKKEKLLLAIYIVGLFANIAFCAVLIPASPLMGTVLAIVFTKALVGLMTVSYCQRRLRMIPVWPVLQLCLAGGAGLVLYFPAKVILPREAAEIMAIAPVLILALYWRRNPLYKPAGKAALPFRRNDQGGLDPSSRDTEPERGPLLRDI